MPQPSTSQVHVDRPLTQMSVGWMQADTRFVASRVAPTIPVQKQSDRYFEYNRADFYRDGMRLRAPGDESHGSGFNIDNTPSYAADVWAEHKDVPDQIRDNQDMPVDLERDSNLWLTQQALIRKEKIFAAHMAASIWDNQYTGVTATPTGDQFLSWKDANSTPIQDIRAATTAVANTGYEPNTMVMSRDVRDVLVDNPQIVDRVKYGTQNRDVATVDESELAALFKIPRVFTMNGVEATSEEGAAEVRAFIGGTFLWVGHVAPNPGIMVPSALYTFAWVGHLGANAEGGVINRIPLPWRKAVRIEIELAIAMKRVATALGAHFTSPLIT